MPMYPDILKRANLSGTVQLSALIDERGQVIDVQVIKSISVVDSVCVEAAKQWKFTPGRLADQNGKYINAKFWFPIAFEWNL